MGSPVLYLAVYSDLSESPLLLGAFTAQLALAKQAVLVSAVLVEVGGRLVLPTLTALFLPNRRLCHLHNQKHTSTQISSSSTSHAVWLGARVCLDMYT